MLIPYDEPYNYNDIAQGLAQSACHFNGLKGYRLFYTGEKPNRLANDLSEPERLEVKFDRFKHRANATQKLSVVCWSKECKGSKKPYSTKVTPAEVAALDLLVPLLNKAQGFKKGLAVIKAT